MPGKVSPDELLAHVFDRTGADADETILQGPANGEDAAAIDWPGGDLVVSSDPISLAASQVGSLGVYVACNDIAASGADPRWLTVVILLPDESVPIETITTDLDAAASKVGASIVGGHSEYVDQLTRPLVSLTAMGAAAEFIPTGGASPGDRVIVTKAAGIEGTAVLAADFGAELDIEDTETVCDRAASFLDEISVVPDARVVREFATAMHDPTEGGVAAGLVELARASGVRLDVDADAIPVREETAELCAAAGVDPLRIFGSGALLATVPSESVTDCLAELAAAGIEAESIGTVREPAADAGPALEFGDETITEPVQDDLYPLWEAADASDEA
ncbi:AIR synthase family protein [Natrialba taiwanensis]|uniref:AIR synthase-like protein domain-containing protein n=1 Tax=Natrialba taiwanensis DSM 12281 TaxID=1230458 RepID=M0AAF4_9EURY|nr:AIR synthase family protein [Natrialba taiwanensis]ELY95371.1 AIR synthase-like protein domain-containing protein [Natrialba taiwanensis DSM 12281]